MSKSFIYKSVFFISIFILIRLFVPFNGLYGQDGHEYYRYAIKLKNFIIAGENPGTYFWPYGYPALGALLSFFFSSIDLSLQIVSVIGALMCFYFSTNIIKENYSNSKNAEAYIFLFLLFSPFMIRQSILVMADMIAAGFITAAYYYCIRYFKTGNVKYGFIFFVFSCATFFLRYGSFLLLIVPACSIAYSFIKKKNPLIVFIVMAIGVLFLIPHLLLNANATDFLNHNLLSNWNMFNFIKSDFNTIDGRSQYMLPNLVYTFTRLFHPGYFVAGLFFFVIAIIKHKFLAIEKIMMFSVLAYFVFLLGAPFQNSRFFIIAMPFVVISSYSGYCFLTDKIKFNKYVLFGFIAIFQFFLFWQSAQVFFHRNKFELSVSGYIKTNTTSKNIYSFDMDVSLKTYISDRKIIGMYAESFSSFERSSLVLFNEKLFAPQWSEKPPMLNWQFLKNNYTLVSLKKFENGWELYEIK